MVYDDDRERRRNRDEEYRRGDFNRYPSGAYATGWPDETSWGYGREYDERYPPRSERRYEETSETFSPSQSFDESGRHEITRGVTEFHPQAVRRYRTESPYGPGSLGWQPEGGYGQGSGYLYGWSPGAQGYEMPTYRTAERAHTEALPYGYGYAYGTSSHLADVPRGRFTGKGPKGYQRSDERVHEDVSEELSQHGEIDASDIQVRVSKCEVTLDGEVETREQKRLAEDIVEACPGVREVHNNLHVRKGFFARLFGIEEDRPARTQR